jgi:hypothetical protein
MAYDLLQSGELNIILEAVNAFLGAVFGRQNSTIILKDAARVMEKTTIAND